MSNNPDLYEKIVSQRSGLSWLMGKIPGFRGYMEMTLRRTADRLIRDHIAREFTQRLTRLSALERDLLGGGGLMHMDKTKSVKTKLQTLIDRIATDAPGYSGFFAAVSIGPDELEAIYAFDEAMLRYTETLDTQLDELQNAIGRGEGIPEAIRALDGTTIEGNSAYDLRDDLLKGIA
jgi:hypothetical protein